MHGLQYTLARLCVHRKCTTGEGVFMFDTKDPDAIFDRVQKAARQMTRDKKEGVNNLYQVFISYYDDHSLWRPLGLSSHL